MPREEIEQVDKVKRLQDGLYAAAKSNPKRRFHSLRDKVYRRDILERAWKDVRENHGAPGPDGVTIYQIEEGGVAGFLDGLQQELKEGTYRSGSLLRVEIPKPSGGTRPLGIPNVRDRVAQAALKLVIEPIFEADFLPFSYGYRPGKSAKDASLEVRKWLSCGLEYVFDADIEHCFDEIPHHELMKVLSLRISDSYVLKLVKMWLKAPVLVDGTLCSAKKGTPQGGVISPLLANVYLHQLDAEWVRRGMTNRYGPNAQMVRYADDILVLSDKPIDGPVRTLSEILEGLGLKLSERKSEIVDVGGGDGFDFLGFRFVRRYSQRHGGNKRTFFFPSPDSVKRLKENVRGRAGRHMLCVPPEDVAKMLNLLVRGWMNYYRHSNASDTFRKVRTYVHARFRRFLRRRQNDSGTGRYRNLTNKELIERYGLSIPWR